LPKHISLYKALDFDLPQFAHVPLILNPNGGKLSKRQSHVSVDFYREKDYIPAALINYVALLGWSPAISEMALSENSDRDPKPEIFSLEELTKLFSLKRVQPSNAKLLENKLHFFNANRIKSLYKELEESTTPPPRKKALVDEFTNYCIKYNADIKDDIDDTSAEKMSAIALFTKDRIKLYEELSIYKFFWVPPDFKNEQAQKHLNKLMKDGEKMKKLLQEVYDLLNNKFTVKDFKMLDIAKVCGEFLYNNKEKYNNEEFYHSLRFVLSGKPTGGPATQICEILGKNETLRRIKQWI